MNLKPVLQLLLLTAVACRTADGDWPALKQQLRQKFPTVRQIDAAELAAHSDVVLLDVRTQAEFDVSRIAGARHVPEVMPADIPKDVVIVAYCSVGYRSSVFAERLQRAGYLNVRQLNGGIFEWASEGRPLAGGKVVHPYNARWGRYLKSELRAAVATVRD